MIVGQLTLPVDTLNGCSLDQKLGCTCVCGRSVWRTVKDLRTAIYQGRNSACPVCVKRGQRRALSAYGRPGWQVGK